MGYKNADHLIQKLSILGKTEGTKGLTEFYAGARFRIKPDEFRYQYTDGSDDGGIDFYHREDDTYFIFQSKFTATSRRTALHDVQDELRKLKNTLTGENPNRRAADFVNALKRDVGLRTGLVEIIWLTTNIVEQSLRNQVQQELDAFRRTHGWLIGVDFVAIDRHALDSVIYDLKHGYVPYTGRRVLKLEDGQWMETNWEDTNVYSVVCTIEVTQLLKWFRRSEVIGNFLQKNVREFLGDKSINRAIAKSYLDSPNWFWYKHNGIIIFVDNLSINKTKLELTLRNPQVVNGGQTLSALYGTYDKQGRRDSPAKILLRIFRLPYEDTETYQRSIEIIAALNSQNKIQASDLHSTDPRQVRLEQLLAKSGDGYEYISKRSKDRKAGRYSITMRGLALPFYVCKKNIPHEGVRGNPEELFEEKSKYDEVFNESAINRELGASHVVVNYVTVWTIDQLLTRIDLPSRDEEFKKYTRWFVLSDVYRKLFDWKQANFRLGWQEWIAFINSPNFETAFVKYSRSMFRTAREMIPQNEEARTFLRRTTAVAKFATRTRKRAFDSLMKRAYTRFERTDRLPNS